jgi:ankyrin repeat protein
MMDALRAGDRATFQKNLGDNPKAANLTGPGGTTPLMYAALYGDADSVRRLLEAGADPNARNESGATALMWAVDDPERTKLLLERKANPNARSENGRTPLLIAADRFGSAPVL